MLHFAEQNGLAAYLSCPMNPHPMCQTVQMVEDTGDPRDAPPFAVVSQPQGCTGGWCSDAGSWARSLAPNTVVWYDSDSPMPFKQIMQCGRTDIAVVLGPAMMHRQIEWLYAALALGSFRGPAFYLAPREEDSAFDSEWEGAAAMQDSPARVKAIHAHAKFKCETFRSGVMDKQMLGRGGKCVRGCGAILDDREKHARVNYCHTEYMGKEYKDDARAMRRFTVHKQGFSNKPRALWNEEYIAKRCSKVGIKVSRRMDM